MLKFYGRKKTWTFAVAIAASLLLIIISIVLAVMLTKQTQAGSLPSKHGCSSFNKPAVILISMDGFRSDYFERNISPNIQFLAKTGVKAENMRPQYPTKTFPNHYSIVTGLYPESHGIVSNSFFDENRTSMFRIGRKISLDSKWWRGEPIWITAAKQGVKSATYFWVGSDAIIKGARPSYWRQYNGKVPFEKRVDQVLLWLEMDAAKRPSLITLYFEEPDTQGHRFGTGASETNRAIRRVDQMIGRLVEGIKKRQLTECVNIILVSDHGMTNLSCSKVIYLDQFISLSNVTVVGQGAFSLLYMKKDTNITKVINRLQCKHENLAVYERKKVPYRLHYRNSKRIGDLVLVPDLGWTILKRNATCSPYYKGSHGYDDIYTDMRSLFIANGPSFKAGLTAPSFSNVEIYNLLTELLDVVPAANNGTFGSLSFMLRSPWKKHNLLNENRGGNFTLRCKFADSKSKPGYFSRCSACYTYGIYSKDEILSFDNHLNLSMRQIAQSLKTNLPWGVPVGGASNNGCLLPQKYYIAGYSVEHHISFWAAYKLTAKHMADHTARNVSCFRQDPRLMINQSMLCFNHSLYGFKRGQLAPSTDFRFDNLAVQDTFISSNIVPYNKDFTQTSGLWHKTEELIREWAAKYEQVYVVSGIIFDADGDGYRDTDEMIRRRITMTGLNLAIPTHYYKMIVKCNSDSDDSNIVIPGCNGTLDAIVFVFPHNERSDCKHGKSSRSSLLQYLIPINDLQKLTGMEFFSKLPHSFAARFKSSLPSSIWL